MDIMKKRLELTGSGTDYMRIAYRSLAVAYALAFFTLHANAQNELFPRPAELEPAVKFWTRVYTEIDTSEGFIHDSLRMDIVYQTVRTGDLGTRERRRRIRSVVDGLGECGGRQRGGGRHGDHESADGHHRPPGAARSVAVDQCTPIEDRTTPRRMQ